MKPLIVLLVTFLISCVIFKLTKNSFNYRLSGRVAMAVMLIFTAIGHFAFSKGMAAMLPDFLPSKNFIVLATGILELLFAVGLFSSKHQNLIGWLLIGFLIMVLPANIKASLQHINYQTGEFDGPGLNYLWFRIPLQMLFIIWTYFSTIRS